MSSANYPDVTVCSSPECADVADRLMDATQVGSYTHDEGRDPPLPPKTTIIECYKNATHVTHKINDGIPITLPKRASYIQFMTDAGKTVSAKIVPDMDTAGISAGVGGGKFVRFHGTNIHLDGQILHVFDRRKGVHTTVRSPENAYVSTHVQSTKRAVPISTDSDGAVTSVSYILAAISREIAYRATVAATGDRMVLDTLVTTESIPNDVVPVEITADEFQFMEYNITGVDIEGEPTTEESSPVRRARQMEYATPMYAVSAAPGPMQKRSAPTPTFGDAASKQLRVLRDIELCAGTKLDLVTDSITVPCMAIGVVEDVWNGHIPSKRNMKGSGTIASTVFVTHREAHENFHGLFHGRAHFVLKSEGGADTFVYDRTFLPERMPSDAPYPFSVDLGEVNGVTIVETVVDVQDSEPVITDKGTEFDRTVRINVEIINPANRPHPRVELWKKERTGEGITTVYTQPDGSQYTSPESIDPITGDKNTVRITVPPTKMSDSKTNLVYMMSRHKVEETVDRPEAISTD